DFRVLQKQRSLVRMMGGDGETPAGALSLSAAARPYRSYHEGCRNPALIAEVGRGFSCLALTAPRLKLHQRLTLHPCALGRRTDAQRSPRHGRASVPPEPILKSS